MNFFQAVILGIVEGASEFLPISSTGHLMIAAKVLGLAQTEFVKSFEISIQLGAILAVVVLYWRKLLVNFEVLKRVLVAFLPTAVLGFIFYKVIKKVLLSDLQVVLWSLFLGGIFLIIFEIWIRGKDSTISEISEMPYKTAIWIGVFQSLAMIPGVSRSAASIVGGLWLGLERETVVEFSFLLAVPTMLAATAFDLLKSAHTFSHQEFEVLGVGFAVSFFAAIFCIKWLIEFVKNHTFIQFGFYRIFVAVSVWLMMK